MPPPPVLAPFYSAFRLHFFYEFQEHLFYKFWTRFCGIKKSPYIGTDRARGSTAASPSGGW